MISAGRWRKLGLIFRPDGNVPWMHSHAAVPIAEPLGDGLLRIYFSTRDAQQRSHTGSLVVDLSAPTRVLELSTSPVLVPGALGEFDDSGAMATWLAVRGERRYLYYIGWNLGVTVPFRNSIGLAISDAGGPFVRVAPGPIVDRTVTEPHFCASCCVLPGDDLWRMWYLSCTGWWMQNGRPQHRYHIKYAESSDGITWHRDGTVAIDFASDDEYAISRPTVIRDEDGWHMWYSHRGDAYRIGYAQSRDGRHWTRHDATAGIDVSPTGWDSQAIAYPCVFDHAGQRYMLYNGNNYGESGFGIAIMEDIQ